MAENRINGGDPLGKILIAIGMVREEIAGLRDDLLGKSRASPAAGQGAPPISMAVSEISRNEFRSVMLERRRFFVNLLTGHAYHREANGSKGSWAGLFKKTGNPDPKKATSPWIDESVPEPKNNHGGGKRTRKRKTRKH